MRWSCVVPFVLLAVAAAVAGCTDDGRVRLTDDSAGGRAVSFDLVGESTVTKPRHVDLRVYHGAGIVDIVAFDARPATPPQPLKGYSVGDGFVSVNAVAEGSEVARRVVASDACEGRRIVITVAVGDRFVGDEGVHLRHACG